jgi:hypothetical protein
MMGGFPKSRENGVSMWIRPSLQVSPDKTLQSRTGLQGLDESWRPLLGPDGFSLDIDGIVKLGSSFALGSNDDNSYTSTFKCSAGQGTDTRSSTWSEIDGVSSGGREIASFCPMDMLGEDLVT